MRGGRRLLGDVRGAADAGSRGPAERGGADRAGAPGERRRGRAAVDADGRARRGSRRARARTLHRAHDLQGHADLSARVNRSPDRGVRRDEQRLHLVRHDPLRFRGPGRAPTRDRRAARGPRDERKLPARRDRAREESGIRGDEPGRGRPGQVPRAPPLRGGVRAASLRPAAPRHARVHRAPAARPTAGVLSQALRAQEYGGGPGRRRHARGGSVRRGGDLRADSAGVGRPAGAVAAAHDRPEPARGRPASRAAGVPRPCVEDGPDRRRGHLPRGPADLHPGRLAELPPEPGGPRAAAPRLVDRSGLRRLAEGGPRHGQCAARPGERGEGGGRDPRRDPEGARDGSDGGGAAAGDHHRGVLVRVRHRDGRGARESVRPGRNHLDARGRGRLPRTAPPDRRRGDPGRRAQVLRRRHLRARAVHSDGTPEVTAGTRRAAALGLVGLLAVGVLVVPSAELALEPTLLPDDVDRERDWLLSRVQKRRDNASSRAFDAFYAALYGPHPYALPVLGTPESLARIDHAAIVAAYRAGYRPDRMVLAVSGQVAASEVLAEAQRRFGGVARDGAGVDPPVPAPIASARRVELEMPAQQSQILAGSLAPPLHPPDHAAVKVLSTILGGGMAGRLFAELRDKQGLAYTATSYYDPVREPGALVLYLGTAPENAQKAESALLAEVERIRREPVSADELARAKGYLLGRYVMDRRTNERLAWYLAFYEIEGQARDLPERYQRAVEAVSVADVLRVARQYLGVLTTLVVRAR